MVKRSLTTNLSGRVKNTSLPLNSALLPLFEAVVNSIHSIEEAKTDLERASIRVKVLRNSSTGSLELDDQKKGGRDALEDIYGFVVSDNGCGFDDLNLESFQTLDSDHKLNKGGRGVGRLLWLKAFDEISVSSVHRTEGDKYLTRSFNFTEAEGVSSFQEKESDAGISTGASVELKGFKKRYRESSVKTGERIAQAIVEHCLWYFLRPGGAPDIRVEDEENTFFISENFEQLMASPPEPETIEIKGRKFDLVHVARTAGANTNHSLVFCADQRVVKEEKLGGKIPGLHGKLGSDEEGYFYSCYLSSNYLDEHVRSERTDFEIPETVEEIFEDSELSFDDIRSGAFECIRSHLEGELSKNREKARERVSTFVAQKSPRYRPVLSRVSDDQLNIDPGASDKEIELTLHKQFAKLESELLEEGHNILQASPGEDFAGYEEMLKQYLNKASDVKKSDLAGYVSHRRVILDLFQKALSADTDGKYSKEDLIHQLIMPMRANSNEIGLNAGNLWLIDERLAFHDYLASDKTLKSMSMTGSRDTKEPDLVALNFFDTPSLFSDSTSLPPASLEVIEIKRPVRNDYGDGPKKDPIAQSLDYLQRVKDGEAKTSAGRPIPQSSEIPGFCYILADLTPSLAMICERTHDLTKTSDGMGYFGYKKNLKAYVEVIGFDRLLQMARERNRAFFDKLGLSAT